MERKASVHAAVNAIARGNSPTQSLAESPKLRCREYLEDLHDARIIESRRRDQKPGDTVSIGELMVEYGMAD